MSGQVKSFGLTIIAAGLLIGLSACSQATEPAAPAVEPQVAEVVTEAPTVVPTEAPTSVPQAGPLTAEEMQKLRDLAYTMSDGTTASPASATVAGAPRLTVDWSSVRTGDLNADGIDDYLLVLVNTTVPDSPELILAPVINDGTSYSSPGVITLSTDTDIRNVQIGNGTVTATVWEKTADGTGYQVRQATFKMESGQLVEVDPGQPMPAPAPMPTEAPAPVAPQITMSLSAEEIMIGEQVDIYVHAFESPSVMSIELHRDGEKVDEWISPDPAGVPYVHHTFVWTPTGEGDFEFTAIVRDMWGGEGWSDPEDLDVIPGAQ